MAKKHLLKLQKELFDLYGKEVEEIEKKVNRVTKAEMIDPEIIEDISFMIRDISKDIQNLNSGLFLASRVPSEFMAGYNSLKNLIKTLRETGIKIKEQEPDNPIIKEYEKAIAKNLPLLSIYESIKEVKDYPKSKKREKKWIRKGWYDPDKPFYPFRNLWEELKAIHSYIEENL